jgi:hypothetical protein
MKTRKHIPTKILTVSATGELTRHEPAKIPTDVKIKQLISALGIDPEEYKFRANIRKLNKAFLLGINM